MTKYSSWGRYPKIKQQGIPVTWRSEPLPECNGSLLPYGQGRSYGDCCLNEKGVLLERFPGCRVVQVTYDDAGNASVQELNNHNKRNGK